MPFGMRALVFVLRLKIRIVALLLDRAIADIFDNV